MNHVFFEKISEIAICRNIIVLGDGEICVVNCIEVYIEVVAQYCFEVGGRQLPLVFAKPPEPVAPAETPARRICGGPSSRVLAVVEKVPSIARSWKIAF